MNEPWRDASSGELMRRVLEAEEAARRTLDEAQADAQACLERARADSRTIEALAAEWVRCLHERARQADAGRCEALWQEVRKGERQHAADTGAPTRAAALVAGWLSGAGEGGPREDRESET